MAFDISKTISLVRGGLLDAEVTWQSYLDGNPTWQQTATQLTGPLLIANVLLSLIFSRLAGGYSAFGYQSGWLASLVFGLVMGALGVIIATFVFNYLSGIFKGTPNFSRAFAVVSLAAIPAWVAGAVGALIPFLGFFIALAGGILSLIYLYRLMPIGLNVPQEKRTLHFIASLLLVFLVNMVIGAFLGMGMGMGMGGRDYVASGEDRRAPAAAGVFGEFARQGEMMQAAGADTYDPPASGKLEEDQVEAFVSVLRKTRSIQEEYAEKMQKLSAEMEANQAAGKDASLSDLRKIYSGAGAVVSAGNAEMEVVKSGGGNWAEHDWVRQQLRTARYQQGEGSDANAYNYALYQKYEQVLND